MIDPPFQWQIVRAQLDPTRGSEQAGTRPVLIVSHEDMNTRLPIVTILPLTTLRPGRRIYPTEVLLPPEVAGQPNASIVMAHQIRTLTKERLLETYGRLEDEVLRERIRQILKTHLDLR
jgi:mRNA interferase MazF